MHGQRGRFGSTWHGIAMIIFFAGIFLNFEIFGISGTIVGIFMWIIGGSVANIIFGPKTRKSRRSSRSKPRKSIKLVEDQQYCIACGTGFSQSAIYCPECGTTTYTPEQEKIKLKEM